MRIISYINKGNSFPIILEDNGRKYFVKLNAGMSGKYALVSEWIGNKLGTQLNIKTQIPKWIELNKDLIFDKIHVEVKELIAKSYGANIGFAYQEEAIAINKEKLSLLNKQESTEIFLFDLMMINIDRTPDNTNLMDVGKKVISVDYESSLLFQALIGNRNLLDDPRILKCLRNNPLYKEIEPAEIEAFISKTEKIRLPEILDGIPTAILGRVERNLFIKGFKKRSKNSWFLKETMSKLKVIKKETKSEHKVRINQNQENFKRKLNENSTN